MRKSIIISCLLFIVALILYGYNPKKEIIPDGYEKARLLRVIDGDTIAVEMEGTEYKVRLIGINTPESVAPDEYTEKTGKANSIEGEKASEFTKSILKDQKTVYLQKDISNTDKYDRLLRYVWIEIPQDSNNQTEVAEKMLNGILIREQIAEIATYEPDTSYSDVFASIMEGR